MPLSPISTLFLLLGFHYPLLNHWFSRLHDREERLGLSFSCLCVICARMGLTAPKSNKICKILRHHCLNMLEIIMGLKQRFWAWDSSSFLYSCCTKFLYWESEESPLISADMFLLAVYVLLMSEPSIGLVPGLTLTCIPLTWRSGTAHEY